MYSISVKDLRKKLPLVRSELKKGTSFLLIYQSTPIGKITPVDASIPLENIAQEDVEVEDAALKDFQEDDDFLDAKELKYYMKLRD